MYYIKDCRSSSNCKYWSTSGYWEYKSSATGIADLDTAAIRMDKIIHDMINKCLADVQSASRGISNKAGLDYISKLIADCKHFVDNIQIVRE